MDNKPLELEKIVELREVVHESYNGQEAPPYELSLFAEKMEDDEVAKRFYEARTGEVLGQLLLTDRKLIFIGKTNGERVGAIIEIDSVIGVEIDVEEKDRALASLSIFTEEAEFGLEYKFIMSRFGLDALSNSIMEHSLI